MPDFATAKGHCGVTAVMAFGAFCTITDKVEGRNPLTISKT